MTDTTIHTKIENEPLWQEANTLAEYIYSKLAELPEDEKWNSTNKLRASAVDLIFYTAEALGNTSKSAADYDWGNARKHAIGIKTVYRFVCRQHYLDLEPEIMVKLSKFVEMVDDKMIENNKQHEFEIDKELSLWRTKYEIWKKISNEN